MKGIPHLMRLSSCGNEVALAPGGKIGGESLAEDRGEKACGKAHASLPVL